MNQRNQDMDYNFIKCLLRKIMFERFKQWLAERQRHYGFISRAYEKHQQIIKENEEALAQSSQDLSERAGRQSAYNDTYLAMHEQHKEAFDNYKQNAPSSKFLFFMKNIFGDTVNFFLANSQLDSQAAELQELAVSNARSKPLFALWEKHEQDMQLFGQNQLIGKYDALNSKGVCDGLISEWTRFHTKYPHGEQNFLEKLNNKLNSDSPENFVARVATLHTQQAFHKQQNKDFYFITEGRLSTLDKRASQCASQEEIINQAINYFKENANNNLAAIDFKMEDLNEGHAVGIRCIRNDKQEIEAYVFYDPNRGELTFKGENKEQNLQAFFSKWTATMAEAMTPASQDVASSPAIQITLETYTTSSRINLLSEKKKEQLHTPKPSVRENTPAPQPTEPQVTNETSADNDYEEERPHSVKI